MPVASRTALTAATTSPRASAATASGGSWKEFDDMARPRTDLRTAYGTGLRRLVTSAGRWVSLRSTHTTGAAKKKDLLPTEGVGPLISAPASETAASRPGDAPRPGRHPRRPPPPPHS